MERRQYDIVVIGEEQHVAYNRVGLTSFFEHRKVEDLYLNPKEWVRAIEPNQLCGGRLLMVFEVLIF